MLRALKSVGTMTALLMAIGVTDAAAEPWVVQTGCSSVVIGGITYRQLTFAFHNVDPNHGADLVSAWPVDYSSPDQACYAVTAEAPDTWIALANPNDGTAVWSRGGDDAFYLAPGDSVDGFRLAVRPGSPCCFTFSFTGPFEPFAGEMMCFECSLPVSVRRATWGAVKQIYRWPDP